MPLEGIRRFFERHMAAPPAAADDAAAPAPPDAAAAVQVAACALLLELAHADADFSDAERRHLEDVLRRHFAADDDAARELIALAETERRQAVDLYQFTSLITAHYDEGQRMVLAEIMWRMVYADGELSRHESMLLRRLSSLLDLRPGYLAEARKRAEAAERGGG